MVYWITFIVSASLTLLNVWLSLRVEDSFWVLAGVIVGAACTVYSLLMAVSKPI